MSVIEFCHHAEMYAWEEYAFEGASQLCERLIDAGRINVDTMSIAYAVRMIVREQGINA